MFSIEKSLPLSSKVIILSPHYDDALLSCFSILEELRGHKDVEIINIFTQAHSGPYTLSAQKYLADCGHRNADSLYSSRQQEDMEALARFECKIRNLNLQDALFRRSKSSILGKVFPELDHFYPTYKWHIKGKLNSNDTAQRDLENELLHLYDENVLVFSPIGIGAHVDHILTRVVSEKIFKNIIFYSDFPYNYYLQNYGDLGPDYKKVSKSPNLAVKRKILKKYKTQYKGLFGGSECPKHSEVYFVKRKDEVIG